MAKYFKIDCFTNLVGTNDEFFVKVPDDWTEDTEELVRYADEAAYDNASQYGDVVGCDEVEDWEDEDGNDFIYAEDVGASIDEVKESEVWEDVREDFTKNDLDSYF